MKEKKRFNNAARLSTKAALMCFLIVAVCAVTIQSQTAAAPSDAEALQKRLARARAFAAAHNLTAATFELDAIRTAATDDAVRDVARIMLIGIYLEQGDYGRAQNLLEETYKARSAQHEGSCRSYFAVAGQTVNGIRAHLDRYRTFGLNIADKDLPTEALNDLNNARALLERVIAQAKEIGAGDAKNTDAFALLEDVANMRATLSRNEEEREQWRREVADARQHLAASESRMAAFGGTLASANPAPALIAASGTINAPKTPAETAASSSSTNNPEAEKKAAESNANASDASVSSTDGHLLNIGSLVEKATQKVSPTYPAFAKAARMSGIVRVELVVDERGAVTAAKGTDGPDILKKAAVDAAKRWKFRPTLKDGQPVRVTGFLSFNFAP